MRRFFPVLIAAVLLTACSAGPSVGATSAPTTASATSTPPATPVVATPASTPIVVEATPEPTEEAQLPLKVVKSGFSTFKGKYDDGPQLGYGIVIENSNTTWIADQVDLSIAFIDDKGDVIDTVDQTFAAILPGQRVAWGDVESDYSADWSNMKSMEINLAEPDWEAFSSVSGAYSFTKLKMARDTLGSITVTGRLVSTFSKELENPQIVAIFYRGSKIVGGGWTFLEHARDGVAVKIDTSYSGKADKVEVYGVLSNLSLFSN